jgi:hypothetical protein
MNVVAQAGSPDPLDSWAIDPGNARPKTSTGIAKSATNANEGAILLSRQANVFGVAKLQTLAGSLLALAPGDGCTSIVNRPGNLNTRLLSTQQTAREVYEPGAR